MLVKSIQKRFLIVIFSKYPSNIYIDRPFYLHHNHSGENSFYIGLNPDSDRPYTTLNVNMIDKDIDTDKVGVQKETSGSMNESVVL